MAFNSSAGLKRIELENRIEQLDAVIAGGAEEIAFEGRRVRYNLAEAKVERARLLREHDQLVDRSYPMRLIAIVPMRRGR